MTFETSLISGAPIAYAMRGLYARPVAPDPVRDLGDRRGPDVGGGSHQPFAEPVERRGQRVVVSGLGSDFMAGEDQPAAVFPRGLEPGQERVHRHVVAPHG